MEKILVGIYLAGSLVSIYGVATIVEPILKKQKKLSDKIISNRVAAIMAFMLAFAPTYWIKSNFDGVILDGKYRINVAIEFPGSDDVLYLPADIFITSDVEYIDDSYYSGAAEIESTKAVFNREIYLFAVYHQDGITEIFSCDDVVQAEVTEEVWIEDDIYKVNIGVITPETLRISDKDVWDEISLVNKAEVVFICLCNVFGVMQHFVISKDATNRKKENHVDVA